MNGEINTEDGEFLYHEACDHCGSSDAKAVYSNGSSYCFSCTKYYHPKGDTITSIRKRQDFIPEVIQYKALRSRKIDETTARKFNYGYHDGKHITNYYDKDGTVVAQKFRTKDKKFSWIGNAKEADLFGMNLWKPHPNKRITITEGEIDAMTISMLQDNRFPVISLKDGAGSAVKAIKKHLEYLMGFKEVVLCFDMDEAGRKAVQDVVRLFPPSKCFVTTLPLKDANKMLQEGKAKELISCLWESKPFKPDDILSGEELITRLIEEPKVTSYPFPDWLQQTNEKTKGIRLGSLDIITSGTGCGKTTFLKQLQYHYYETTKFNQGIIHLEEPLTDTVKGLVGISLGSRLHLDSKFSKEQQIDKAKELFMDTDSNGYNRFQVYDAFGSVQETDLYNKIRYFVTGLDCKIIWLDHLSILVSDLDGSMDERRKIDSIMHNLKSLTIELGCYIGLVVHLNNATNGKTFEEGALPTLNNLRGSGGIKQLSDTVYALSRNSQADNELERNTSLLSVLKCRFTGDTGRSDFIFFNKDTGCMEAGKDPKEIQGYQETMTKTNDDF